MSELFDARTAAWISAWNCVEAAQKARVTAMEVAEKRHRENDGSDATHYFSQMSQQYNGLLEEARIYADLASVPGDMVGYTAGGWMRDQQAAREREEAMQAEFMDRIKKQRQAREAAKVDPDKPKDERGQDEPSTGLGTQEPIHGSDEPVGPQSADS